MESVNIEGLNFDLLGSEIRNPITKVGEVNGGHRDNPLSQIDNPVNDHAFSLWLNKSPESWVINGATWTQDGEVVDPGFDYSAKCVVASGTPFLHQFRTDAAFLNPLKGYYCMLIAGIRVASGAQALFTPRLQVQVKDGAVWLPSVLRYFYIRNENSETAYADDKWHELWFSFFVPIGATEVRMFLYANGVSGKTGTMYFSNIRVQRGSQPWLIPADIDKDGGVDFIDYALFAQYWQQTDCGECGGADLAGNDGYVSIDDLQQFTENWLAGVE